MTPKPAGGGNRRLVVRTPLPNAQTNLSLDRGLAGSRGTPVRRGTVDAPPVWAYGVTTLLPDAEQTVRGVPDRGESLLPQTLRSLAGAGFPSPRLFVDGARDAAPLEDRYGLPVTVRSPRIGALGNWLLGLGELMIRQPFADYYAVFQDDLLASRNLKAYVDRVGCPLDGYLNLYTFPRNHVLAAGKTGWVRSNQKGLGALGLVFTRQVAVALLSEATIINKPKARDPARRHKFVDGGIVTALNQAGIFEYVHNPSPLQHTGVRSTLANPRHPSAPSFKGEDFDMLSLLEPRERADTGGTRETQRR